MVHDPRCAPAQSTAGRTSVGSAGAGSAREGPGREAACHERRVEEHQQRLARQVLVPRQRCSRGQLGVLRFLRPLRPLRPLLVPVAVDEDQPEHDRHGHLLGHGHGVHDHWPQRGGPVRGVGHEALEERCGHVVVRVRLPLPQHLLPRPTTAVTAAAAGPPLSHHALVVRRDRGAGALVHGPAISAAAASYAGAHGAGVPGHDGATSAAGAPAARRWLRTPGGPGERGVGPDLVGPGRSAGPGRAPAA